MRWWQWVGLRLVFVLLLAYAIWLFVFSIGECYDENCFNEKLFYCSPSVFYYNSEFRIDYEILGKRGDDCMINVLFLGTNVVAKQYDKMVNKSMICSLPLRVVMLPDDDIGNCHGELKEALQQEVIAKLHRYVSEELV